MEIVLSAASLTLLITLLLGPMAIALLRRFRQPVRDYMPKEILAKNTPTMGGIFIVLATVLGTVAIAHGSTDVAYALFVTVGFALVGLSDDFIKVVLKRPLGLKARQKILGQLVVATALVFYIMSDPAPIRSIAIPFSAGYLELPAWATALLAVVVLIASSNAVNITDGLDGLAAGATAVTAFALAAVMLAFSHPDLAAFAGALGGACLGFIWFNNHPALVIMGDVGALGLGAGLATIVVLSHTELYLVLAGGLFVLESLAVMLQVAYFRATKGKRIFKMTPIHYHFQKSGWAETAIVTRFWLVAIMFAILTLMALPR